MALAATSTERKPRVNSFTLLNLITQGHMPSLQQEERRRERERERERERKIELTHKLIIDEVQN